ncbi:hypothetical protein BKI52_05205 [marine bacterium AO1-C]|nr:hypothetical protein BKI52_05205 [marine bacterium AO1-C]
MKKIIFSLTLVVCTLVIFSFNTTKSIYPSFVSTELAKFFDGEYIKTVKDEALNLHLEKNFLPIFDDVTFVHAQKNAKEGFYYYIVFGSKAGKETMALLKATQRDIETNTYSYINFSKIKVTSNTNYCRSGALNPPPGICGLNCVPRFDNCLGFICGVWNKKNEDCDIE